MAVGLDELDDMCKVYKRCIKCKTAEALEWSPCGAAAVILEKEDIEKGVMAWREEKYGK